MRPSSRSGSPPVTGNISPHAPRDARTRAPPPGTGEYHGADASRHRGGTNRGGEAAVSPEGTATAHAEVQNELRELRSRVKHVEGSIVATTDGMVIAHDLAASEAY